MAEGKAHLYPRLGPMMEWDSAAGACIVKEAGGFIVSEDDLPITYNTRTMRHENLIALSYA